MQVCGCEDCIGTEPSQIKSSPPAWNTPCFKSAYMVSSMTCIGTHDTLLGCWIRLSMTLILPVVQILTIRNFFTKLIDHMGQTVLMQVAQTHLYKPQYRRTKQVYYSTFEKVWQVSIIEWETWCYLGGHSRSQIPKLQCINIKMNRFETTLTYNKQLAKLACLPLLSHMSVLVRHMFRWVTCLFQWVTCFGESCVCPNESHVPISPNSNFITHHPCTPTRCNHLGHI